MNLTPPPHPQKSRSTFHTTAKGQKIDLRDMNDQHLLNCLAKLSVDQPVLNEFCALLLEVSRRGLWSQLRERLENKMKGLT